jgi:hypothetical protein
MHIHDKRRRYLTESPAEDRQKCTDTPTEGRRLKNSSFFAGWRCPVRGMKRGDGSKGSHREGWDPDSHDCYKRLATGSARSRFGPLRISGFRSSLASACLTIPAGLVSELEIEILERVGSKTLTRRVACCRSSAHSSNSTSDDEPATWQARPHLRPQPGTRCALG